MYKNKNMNLKDLHITQEELEKIKITGWDFAVDSIIITMPRKKWDGRNYSTPIVYANPAFERITGYSVKEVVGEDPRFLQGPKTDRSVINKILTAMEKDTVFRGETYNYKKDGTPFVMSWHIESIKNSQNEIIAFLAIQRDVTKIRELEAKEKELENFKSNFVRLASHQIRTPLTSAKWNLELVMDTIFDKEGELLSDASASLERVSARLQTILSVLDIQYREKDVQIKKEVVNIPEVFNLIDENTKSLQKERNIRCSFKSSTGFMHTNADRLVNALMALVTNAIVYSEEGEIVKIVCEKNREGFIFTVSDEGIGISEDDAAILWEPFARGKEAEVKWTDGIGSELWIAKRNVIELGGEIDFNSKGRSHGSMFTIQFNNNS